jgi:hypothetical protein
MAGVVDARSDCGNSFNAYDGLYHVERLQNGWARVDDRHSGVVTMVDPADDRILSGFGIPVDLFAEILRRWG